MSTLAELPAHLRAHAPFQDVLSRLAAGGDVRASGLSPGAQALAIAALPHRWLLVAPDADAAQRWADDLEAYGAPAALFPPVEVTPASGVSPESELFQRRQEVLARLAIHAEPLCVVTTAKALALTVPSPAALREACLVVKPGMDLAPAALTSQLVRLGYKPGAAVADRGDFARRGGILDLYPPDAKAPVRLEWFGDTLESLRTFDPATQRSTGELDQLTLVPTRELVLPEAGWDAIATRIRKAMEQQVVRLKQRGKAEAATRLVTHVRADLEKLAGFQAFEGCEIYAPFVDEDRATILDYLAPEAADGAAPGGPPVVVWMDRQALLSQLQAWTDKVDEEDRQRIGEGGVPLPVPLVLPPGQVEARAAKLPQLDFADRGSATWNEDAGAATAYGNQFDRLAEAMEAAAKAQTKVVVASTQPQRVFALLDERNVHATFGGHLPEPGSAYGGIWILRESLSSGFVWPGLGLSVLGDRELFGWQKRTRKGRDRRPAHAGAAFTNVGELKVGDFVVHTKHGIGQYAGLVRMEVERQAREYLLVKYRGEDKLYVPVDQLGLLHRYRAAADGAPRLHKMGGAEWDAIKSRVKKSVQDLAEELLKLYAQRASLPGYPFPEDTVWQRELEEGFPYTETPDQLRAIAEVKRDMESPRPMDRLICGDVGFGKTEVALRAVFKALMAGKQVAVLAPTTLLAQQHYGVLRERFAPYPVKAGLLSRFKTPREVKETLKGLSDGSVDLVVGTHRLLQKDVAFKDLGLLVIDEEHRFGVAHKERLKQLKAHVDVLTLSATPIPRTLYLALSGARDMSLITTAPTNRQPVKTAVGPYDPEAVRTAILHELERGGQVFYLHNRIETIAKVAHELQELVPGARVAVGHGQMDEGTLEDLMLGFLDHETDVLVSTTIIESGLDIPSANTMIIDDADRFGLAQLYQLRGRVGRSDRRAYCHCFYRPGKELTDEARERLQALQQFTALGSGYQIALRDMEIRGVGNILGSEQHGHMLSVGYDLYMRLLEEAVAERQEALEHGELEPGEAPPRPHEPVLVDLQVAAFLPDDWFLEAGDGAKLDEYKRLAAVTSRRELKLLGEGWRDRFGELPQSARNLLRIVDARLRAEELDGDRSIAAIRSDAKGIRATIAMPRHHWADLALRNPALARWTWQQGEVALARDRAPDVLGAVEKLLDALEALGVPAAV